MKNVVVEKTALEVHSETVVKHQEPITAKAKEVPAAEETKEEEAVEAKVERKKHVTEEVLDEICSNEQYSEAKSITAASKSVAPASTSSRKLAGGKYYTLTYYDDPSDSD